MFSSFANFALPMFYKTIGNIGKNLISNVANMGKPSIQNIKEAAKNAVSSEINDIKDRY